MNNRNFEKRRKHVFNSKSKRFTPRSYTVCPIFQLKKKKRLSQKISFPKYTHLFTIFLICVKIVIMCEILEIIPNNNKKASYFTKKKCSYLASFNTFSITVVSDCLNKSLKYIIKNKFLTSHIQKWGRDFKPYFGWIYLSYRKYHISNVNIKFMSFRKFP